MSASGEATIVQCSCGKKLKAPASNVARKAKCPGCGAPLTIPASGAAVKATPATAASPKPAAARPAVGTPVMARAAPAKPAPPKRPPPPPAAPEPDPLDDIYALAEDEKRAAQAPQTDTAPRCPQCGADMAVGATLCVKCGYDIRTQRKVTAPSASARPPMLAPLESSKAKKKPVDMMAPQGSFVVGLLYSAGFAIGAGTAWFAVTWAIHWDIFFLSILIGVAAGLGMQIGQKGYSTLGGAVAAGITLLTIIGARVAVVLAILLPMATKFHHDSGDDEESDRYDYRVVEKMTEDNLKAAGVEKPLLASDEQREAAEKSAKDKLKSMSKDEYQHLVAQADEEEKKEELTGMLAAEMAKQRGVPTNDVKAYLAALASLESEARQRVDAMSPAQRAAEIKRLEAQAEEEAKAEVEAAKNSKSSSASGASSGAGSGVAAAIGFAAIMLLLFGIKIIIVTIIAMAIAYRTASGSVSG